MPRPDPSHYAAAYHDYISLVPEQEILPAMQKQLDEILTLLRGVSDAVGNQRHPPYTWSIKEVVGHLNDAERVFGYRAMRFARADATPLAGFDENAYVLASECDRTPLADLTSEFEAIRRSNLWLFKNLPAAAWSHAGEANGNAVTVHAVAYLIVGHARHHANILRKRLSGEVEAR